MRIDSYLVGQAVRLHMRAVDITGQDAVPGSVTLRIRAGNGAVSAYEAPTVVCDSPGVYHADITLTSHGLWAYRWELAPPCIGVAEGTLHVNKSRVL